MSCHLQGACTVKNPVAVLLTGQLVDMGSDRVSGPARFVWRAMFAGVILFERVVL